MIAIGLFWVVVAVVVFGIFRGARVLRRSVSDPHVLNLTAGVLLVVLTMTVVVPVGVIRPPWVLPAVAAVALVGALVCLLARFESDTLESDIESWAAAYEVVISEGNADFVAAAVHEGHRLRLVCGIGGFVAALALAAGFGLDLKVTGWTWLLTGYLVGVVWSAVWSTRLPTGTKRAASLIPRRLADYLPRYLIVGQVVVVASSVTLIALALARGSHPSLVDSGTWNIDAVSAGSLRWSIIALGIVAFVVMGGVAMLQRHLVRRPQPAAAPDLLAADDAVRAAAIHLLSGTAIAIVVLLVGTQVQMLAAIGDIGGGLAAGIRQAGLVVAIVAWRYSGNRAWKVRGQSAQAHVAVPGAGVGR